MPTSVDLVRTLTFEAFPVEVEVAVHSLARLQGLLNAPRPSTRLWCPQPAGAFTRHGWNECPSTASRDRCVAAGPAPGPAGRALAATRVGGTSQPGKACGCALWSSPAPRHQMYRMVWIRRGGR